MSALADASEWREHRTNTVPRLTERTDIPMFKVFGVLSSPQLGQRDRADQQVFTASSGNYTTHRAWFLDVLKGENVILCRTSALECHGLFSGYLSEKQIDVYALERGKYLNIDYFVVDTFDGIEVVHFGHLACTSVNQTINDMLADFDNIDEQSFVEGLGSYYFLNGGSFNGLDIALQNMERFNTVKDWAIEYWEED